MFSPAYAQNVKNGRPCGRPWKASGLLSLVLDQAVAAVGSLIDNRKRAVVVFVAEGEERMLQQIHLQDRLFAGHRLHVEFLHSHELEGALFRLIRSKRGFVRGTDERVLPQAPGQACLLYTSDAADE